ATAAPLVDGLTDTQLASIGYTREDLTSDLLITAAFIEAPVPPCNQNDAAIFNADGSVTSDYSDDCGTDIFIESENPLAPDEERGETKTYLLDGNVLTLTSMGTFSDSPVETYEIVELTATSLKIRLSDQTLTEQLLDTENLGEVDFKGMFVQLNFVAL
ncbi:MAG: lipocalin family protein, partial [Bacteroidota bacterium]